MKIVFKGVTYRYKNLSEADKKLMAKAIEKVKAKEKLQLDRMKKVHNKVGLKILLNSIINILADIFILVIFIEMNKYFIQGRLFYRQILNPET